MFCKDFMLFKEAKRVQLKGAATKGFGSESVITVAFQSVFHIEMHQNNVFFLKKLFLRPAYQNDPKHIKN